MQTDSGSLLRTSRLAGALYLVWIATGLFAMFYVPAQIDTHGDAATTAQSILSHELLYRTTIVNDLASCTIWVFMVLVLYRMFRPVDEGQAKLLVAFVIVQIPAVFFMEAFSVAALMAFKGDLLETFELSQRQDLAVLFLRISDYASVTLQAFWGLWLVPLAILVLRSRFLPRFLGVWLIVTGLFYLVLCFTSLMLPEYKDMVLHNVLALPAELGEVAFMLWLLIRGARTSG